MRKPESFGVKLWRYFALFSAAIFAALWLLQTVFLQGFYDHMAIRNVERAADQIVRQQEGEDLPQLLDELAYNNSFLIFLTDREGDILYCTDEHSGVYGGGPAGDGQKNPYHGAGQKLNWQTGARHYLGLPRDYDAFLERLLSSESGTVGYRLDAAYVCGRLLPGEETVLYISAALEAVGGTAGILRLQLIWVTATSLLLALGLAAFLSRRFSAPLAAICGKAERMAAGNFSGSVERGFCAELDTLADTLDQTSDALTRARTFQREFLANISHDLRTPLTMIRGYAEVVRDVSWEDAEQREADLSVIIRETDRLTALVNDILEYTALQEQTPVMKMGAVDLSAAGAEAAERFSLLGEKSGCRLEARIQPKLWVWGNEEQLSRVLYNLLGNAVSHAGENRTVRLTLERRGTDLRAEVRDFGAGIPPEELPHVWERYFTSRQRGGCGSGLGLSISREILQAHHARFGVDSTVGEGSTFYFELPLYRDGEDPGLNA